jgi:hypothetical protein
MTDDSEFHGCPLYREWHQLRTRAETVERQVGDIHLGLEASSKQATALETIAACLTEVKDRLLDSAIGRRHVDLVTFGSVIASLSLIILALLVVVVFLLTGEGAGWIRELHR